MQFTYPLGHRDVNHYVQNPPNEETWRDFLNEMPFELRDYINKYLNLIDDTGAANAYVVTLNPIPTAYPLMIQMKAAHANTGASTINPNGLGAKAIKKNVASDLSADDIPAGGIAYLVYDGVFYQLVNPSTQKSLADHMADLTAHGADKQFLTRQAIINGNFDIWQRGTSFNNPNGVYTADRWLAVYDGTGSTVTVSQQAFTPGQISVPNNPRYFYRWAQTVAGTGGTYKNITQKIEDVNNFSGQQATLSFWAKADAPRIISEIMNQNFGLGGSSTVYFGSQAINLTTSWQKFTVTFNVPSISGKTIGTGNCLELNFGLPLNTVMTIDIAQVQLNAGSVALPFCPKRFDDELKACRRYYRRNSVDSAYGAFGIGMAISATTANIFIPFDVKMRASPTLTRGGNLGFLNNVGAVAAITALSIISAGTETIQLQGSVASGLVAGNATMLEANNDLYFAYIAFDAEL